MLTVRKRSPCVVAGVSAKKKYNEERGREREWRWMRRRRKMGNRESRSREALCLLECGKHRDTGHRCRIRPWGRRLE